MPLQPFEAVKKMCEASAWSISNLELQKLLFLAQRDFLATRDEKLIAVFFEAWDYGPVVPEIYRAARRFGSAPIERGFLSGITYKPSRLDDALTASYSRYGHLSPGQLVAATHKPLGAWDVNYRPGLLGCPIPDGDIVKEARQGRARP